MNVMNKHLIFSKAATVSVFQISNFNHYTTLHLGQDNFLSW
jgi:hypothetical protein